MPCRSDPDEILHDAREEIDRLTKLLCTASKWIFFPDKPESFMKVFDREIVNRGIPHTDMKSLCSWARDHREWDRDRLARAKASALNKLTPEEKEALGIKEK